MAKLVFVHGDMTETTAAALGISPSEEQKLGAAADERNDLEWVKVTKYPDGNLRCWMPLLATPERTHGDKVANVDSLVVAIAYRG